MSRRRQTTYPPGYRIRRLGQFAGSLGLSTESDGTNQFTIRSAGRRYVLKIAGRTTVKLTAFIDGTDEAEAEVVISDERAEDRMVRIARIERGDHD